MIRLYLSRSLACASCLPGTKLAVSGLGRHNLDGCGASDGSGALLLAETGSLCAWVGPWSSRPGDGPRPNGVLPPEGARRSAEIALARPVPRIPSISSPTELTDATGGGGGEAGCRRDFLATLLGDVPVSPKLRPRELVALILGRDPGSLARSRR